MWLSPNFPGRPSQSAHAQIVSHIVPQVRQLCEQQPSSHYWPDVDAIRTFRTRSQRGSMQLPLTMQLKAHASVLEQVVACRDEQLSVLSYFDNACAAPGSASSCFGALSSHLLDPVAIHASEMAPMVQALTAQQVAGQWKTFLADATGKHTPQAPECTGADCPSCSMHTVVSCCMMRTLQAMPCVRGTFTCHMPYTAGQCHELFLHQNSACPSRLELRQNTSVLHTLCGE